MDLKEIATELVAGCREGRETANLDKLYAPDAVSVEPMGEDRETRGRDGIHGKHQWWKENFVVHDARVDGPFPGGESQFAVVFWMDAENKQTGERHEMSEVALYTVADGQITREEFFYG